jgi:LysR family transcriptional regulator, glycine cleavage system transcriptional activator
MAKNSPPLGAIRAFESASRHLSYVKAADEIHVTAAAISHQIKLLEHWLGFKVFDRGARGVSLTPAGRDYAARIRDVYDRLVMTSVAMRTNHTKTVVRIRAQMSVCQLWVMPRLIEFNQKHPEIEIHLMAEGAEDNHFARSAHLAIYNGISGSLSNAYQDLLLAGEYRVYGAPDLFKRARRITAHDVVAAPMLHTVTRDQKIHLPRLEDWLQEAGVSHTGQLPGARLNLFQLTQEACIQGGGFALLLDAFCEPAERKGLLKVVDGPSIPSNYPYFLFCRRNACAEAKLVRAFLLSD